MTSLTRHLGILIKGTQRELKGNAVTGLHFADYILLIFDAIRSIDDIVDYTKRNYLSGMLITIDFEKAFDTLNFNFLIRTLHKFNFGPSFIHWIRVLYKNASSTIMNNGFTTGPFSLERGVRQGDPLSPDLC